MTPLQLLLIDLVIILFTTIVIGSLNKTEQGNSSTATITAFLGGLAILLFPVIAIICIMKYITI